MWMGGIMRNVIVTAAITGSIYVPSDSCRLSDNTLANCRTEPNRLHDKFDFLPEPFMW